MKTLSRTNKNLLFVAGFMSGILILSCGTYQKTGSPGKKVESVIGAILIHPTVKLSQSDEQPVDKI